MNIFKTIWNILKKLFMRVRPDLEEFLMDYMDLARDVVEKLSKVNSGQSLHEWEDEAFRELKALVSLHEKTIKDNWISIMIKFAYEDLLAKKGMK